MMQSPPSSNSLPPLHQAIPEFQTHMPPTHDRRSASVPRVLGGRGSPPLKQSQRVSPSASSGIPETGIPFSNEPTEGSYDAQTYLFPAHLESSRRPNGMSPASSSHLVELSLRPPYLPPVSSLTSSRGSSFDMEPTERATTQPPLLYSPHQPSQSEYMSHHYDHQARSQQTTPDYHQRYSSAPIMSQSPYQSSSPVNQYSQLQYYSHSVSYQQPPSRPQTSYATRHTGPADTLSQFPPTAHPVDLSMDHFEQNRPGKRRRGNLPKHVTDLLRSWLNDHLHHPYPTEDEKQMLMAQTGLTIHQISNWFINARRRRVPAITNGDGRSSAARRTSMN